MNLNKTKNMVGGMILAFSVLFGVGLVSSTTAQAQDRRGDGQERSNRDRDRDNRDRHRGRGRRDNRNVDSDNDGDRDNGNRDWRRNNRNGQYGNGGYGNRGYGNRGYGNNGYNVYQIAQSQGYQDGLNTGASDAQRGQSYNPQRSHYYRNATDGYNSSYGNRGQYQQAYRQGFLQGYQEGFQRYGGYNNRGRNNGIRFPW